MTAGVTFQPFVAKARTEKMTIIAFPCFEVAIVAGTVKTPICGDKAPASGKPVVARN